MSTQTLTNDDKAAAIRDLEAEYTKFVLKSTRTEQQLLSVRDNILTDKGDMALFAYAFATNGYTAIQIGNKLALVSVTVTGKVQKTQHLNWVRRQVLVGITIAANIAALGSNAAAILMAKQQAKALNTEWTYAQNEGYIDKAMTALGISEEDGTTTVPNAIAALTAMQAVRSTDKAEKSAATMQATADAPVVKTTAMVDTDAGRIAAALSLLKEVNEVSDTDTASLTELAEVVANLTAKVSGLVAV